MIRTTFSLLLLLSLPGTAYSTEQPEAVDCSEITIDFTDTPSLTQEERVRLMDKAFYDSLNKYDICQSAKGQAATSGSHSAATAGGTTGQQGPESDASQGNELNNGSMESVASSTLSGTESQDSTQQRGDMTKAQGSTNEDVSENQQNNTRPHGATPQDIPPAENDDALAAQIRYAAENEPDPQKQKKLWNEYRKYKSLPPQ